MNHKEFFDWLRDQQSNNKLTQDMVNGANELLAVTDTKTLKESLEKINNWSSNEFMELSAEGFKLIEEFESFRSKPYLDVAGVPTIGYGTTYYPNNRKVTLVDKPITKDEAKEIKREIINKDFAYAINLILADEIKAGLVTQNMFDAMVSLAYNIGIAGFTNSSVVRNLKAHDIKSAADSFLLWNKARNPRTKRLEVVKGLVNRRNKERDLFLQA